ncbi:MAG: hypothetical protein QS99_C0007G0027 [archaeon GW2011_AR4]|nr:MAG: hypothetical protein QS99_C0007G0027 [archaeon GW2011_AR4]
MWSGPLFPLIEMIFDAMTFLILRHRIILNFEAERQGMKEDDVIQKLIDKIK